jgi:signal transduction histidine kinase
MDTKPVHFLLVDDLEENLLSLEGLLRRPGLVLLKARSGTEALELLLQHDIALALLDVQMPGMDGFELAELMRGTVRTRAVPIIFLTAGSTDWQRRFRGYEAGAVDFLQKPIEPDILRSKAGVFFELFRQRQLLASQRDELKVMAEALQEADRRKDEFLATLAHELRNPLAPIRNGISILKGAPDESMAHEIQDMMDRQLVHLVRLIDDLLDVSRITQGKIELRREIIAIADVLQSAIESSRTLIDGARHTLTVDVPDEKLYFNADLTRLAQVVSNLLNNAAKYTPNEGAISLSVWREGEDGFISVADNGLGIPAEMLPEIFTLFTQVDHNVGHSQGGLGIGLALVKNLVELHGGTISAESAGPNKGSRFTVRLPLAIPVSGDEPKAESRLEGSLAPLRILIVDDNVASAQTIGWMLEMAGHEYHLVHDGAEALRAARKLMPDVILLDIGLPGMDGYEVCRQIRSDPVLRNILVIAQTGWGQLGDKQKTTQAGFDHHLVKPISFDDLTKLLSSAESIPG